MDSIVNLFIGIIGGFLVFAITESLKKPNIVFNIKNESINRQNSNAWKFINVEVENKKSPFLISYFNKTARDARAQVRFIDPYSGIELKSIEGRWNTNSEPIDYNTGFPDPGQIFTPQRETIPIGEKSGIAIAVKFEGVTAFYAFNSHSYLYKQIQNDGEWQLKEYKFNRDHMIVQVIVKSEGYEASEKFVIKNSNISLEDFKLESIQDCLIKDYGT